MNNIQNYLLPDVNQSYIKKDILEAEAYDSIQRCLPLTEDLENLLPENQRKKRLAIELCSICYSLAGGFIETQDESILDDYDWI